MTTQQSRAFGAALPALIAVVGLAAGAGAASADTMVRLPNRSVSGDEGLKLVRTNESARISPSLAANGAGRNAWVTASVKLTAPHIGTSDPGISNGPVGEATAPGTNGSSFNNAAATFTTGYIIGCQVAIGNLTLGGSGSLSSTTVGLSGSLSVPLTPGAVTYAVIDYKNLTKPGTYHIAYTDYSVQVHGCGGYAQARSYTVVETTGDNHQKITLLGQPFSLG
ncbi:hypothetical protein HH308_02380 [Gordonia sp. TBRC 11910]|uniref:MspA protein n=1 Tax=Gordonia asplenii TaxID=2725283 RepID=A0A848KQ29_9ACTN|nr:MspA family porin [Gordonia asplenii]NMO00057.1 hypothetical protein [Gordonia asplenii]